MSFTISVIIRKTGIEFTITAKNPPKNILIKTGKPQHTAETITAPKELSWYAETHNVIAHSDKTDSKFNPTKIVKYFQNNTGCILQLESTTADILLNPSKPYIVQHNMRLTTIIHKNKKIVNVKEHLQNKLEVLLDIQKSLKKIAINIRSYMKED